MFGKIREILLFSNFSRSDLKAVRSQIMEENLKFCVIWSIVLDLFWAYCLIMSISDPLYHQCRNIYIAAFTACTAALVISVYAAPKRPRLIRLTAILLDAVLLLAGLLIARNLAPKTIVVFAAVLIVPVSFITDTLSSILLLLVNVIVFTFIGSQSMDPDTYGWVLSNLIIFSVVGIMIGHFVNKARFERYIFAHSNAKLAEKQARYAHYDQLTDLQNRRAYAETVEELSKNLPPDCRVIIADINGLKEMNDSRGHAAGDELIIGAADCLRQSFGEADQIYRIGGDEFCVIVTDAKWDVAESLHQLEELSKKWKGEFVNGISISAGFASSNEFADIDSVLKAADKRMFVSKRTYYESTGKDRRNR